jgi:hypothetical protein
VPLGIQRQVRPIHRQVHLEPQHRAAEMKTTTSRIVKTTPNLIVQQQQLAVQMSLLAVV